MLLNIVSALKDGRSVTSEIEPFKNVIHRETLAPDVPSDQV
jgi:hypothetical protein